MSKIQVGDSVYFAVWSESFQTHLELSGRVIAFAPDGQYKIQSSSGLLTVSVTNVVPEPTKDSLHPEGF